MVYYIGGFIMKKGALFLIIVFAFISLVYAAGTGTHAPMRYDPDKFTEEMHISRGGQLYDNWWSTTVDTPKPEGDHPLWKRQNSNKRSGYATYRCKECHGWDYKGKDGAYGKGSHYTGFVGVFDASLRMTVKELEAVLRGSTNSEHDFSAFLKKEDISDLALFLKKGVIDMGKYIYRDASPIGGDLTRGQLLYTKTCMTECHGPRGMAINFGDEGNPVFIGTVANKNPWEYLHKARAGQPGTRMSSGILNKWKEENIRDILAYSQTLPTDRPEPRWYDPFLKMIGRVREEPRSRVLEKYRGFGPKLEE
jgi:thiosulfate dehydrogenase